MLLFFRNLLRTVYSLLYTLRYSDLRLFNKLNNLRSPYQSATIRILGNGNSLSEVLDNFEGNRSDIDYMVVNRYVLSDSYQKIKPKYYVLADPHFFKHDEGLSILEQIKVQTTWDMFLFIPSGEVSPELFKNNQNIRLVFYNINKFQGFKSLKEYLYTHNLAMPRAQNVMVSAIYIAMSIGYNIIELYGVEHSWTKSLFVNNNNEVCLDNPHFFDKDISKPKTWKEIQHEDACLHEVLRMYAYMFEAYMELQDIAKGRHVKIYNCTKHSFIDAFERKYQ